MAVKLRAHRNRAVQGFLLSALVLGSVLPAHADDFQPNPLETAPDGKVDCSWATMKKDEYQECIKKKAFFEKMSDEEKATYNEQVKKDQLEARVADLERRVEFLERTRR